MSSSVIQGTFFFLLLCFIRLSSQRFPVSGRYWCPATPLIVRHAPTLKPRGLDLTEFPAPGNWKLDLSVSFLSPLDGSLTLRTPPGGEAEDDVNRGRAEVEAGGMIPLRTVVTPNEVLGGRLLTITVQSGVFLHRHGLGV